MNAIIDLEHTISNSTHRLWMLKGKSLPVAIADYYDKLFQSEFINDDVNANVKVFMETLLKTGSTIIILTAKKEKYRKIVEDWLTRNNIYYSSLIMKPDNFDLSDLVFKENFLSVCDRKIDFALNDVGKECAMFADNNIPCLRIEQK